MAAHKIVSGHIGGITGLRAVAVLTVLLFHLDKSMLPGGYAGVDIFFVISGFVVTRSLIGHHFDHIGQLLLYFYARRLIRIMPALIVMLVVTMVISSMFVPISWLSTAPQDVGKAAFLGFSNVVLALQTDTYFSPAAEYNQYLHTWSLGVEEQFYLISPFLMFWHQRRKQGQHFDIVALSVVAGLSLASLALCAWLMADHQKYAFYLMPPRFWELGLGMALSLTEGRWAPSIMRLSAYKSGALAAGAVAMIGLSLTYPESAGFPFPLAILPVAGSIISIALVTARPIGRLAAILSAAPMSRIGKWSYSIYLWHWPVIVLMRWTVGLVTPFQMIFAIILSISLGGASYYCVELFTQRHPLVRGAPRWQVVGAALAVVLLSRGLGHEIIRHQKRFSLGTTADTQSWYANADTRIAPDNKKCPIDRREEAWEYGLRVSISTSCLDPARTHRLFTVGDSHAQVYEPLLRQTVNSRHLPVTLISVAGCAFIPLHGLSGGEQHCARSTNQLMRKLNGELRSGDILFLPSLRTPRIVNQFGKSPSNPAIYSQAEMQMALKNAVSFLQPLSERGVHIVMEAPTPLFAAPAFRCSDWFNRSNPACMGGLAVSVESAEARRRPILLAMENLVRLVPEIKIWDPLPVLCGPEICRAVEQQKPLFFDADHLSGHGTKLLSSSFAKSITP